MGLCAYCNKTVKNQSNKFCSNKCQANLQHLGYINRWKKGLEDGSRGVNTKNISGHLRRYLNDKYKEACSMCGWSRINPTSGKIPLEIDHIDGNSENNHESNLRLLCPNCHSMTPGFRNLNKGNGRLWRREKYVKLDK